MQINDFKLKILISRVATTSVMKRNMYHVKILLISLIFELRIDLVFQYTQLQLRSWGTKYISILDTIFTPYVQKKFTFQKMSIICS